MKNKKLNLILERAIKRRIDGFMFKYGDHTDNDRYDENADGGGRGRHPGVQGEGKWTTTGFGTNQKSSYSEYCEGILYKEHNDTS